MAEPVATTPASSTADDAKIVAAAHAYGLALADHAAKKEAADAADAAYTKEQEAAHAELTKASEAVAKAQAALLAASTGHPAVASASKAHRESVKSKAKR